MGGTVVKKHERDLRNTRLVAQAEMNLRAFIDSKRGTELWNVAMDFAPLWYPEAHDFASEVSHWYGVHPISAAGIVAAFSVRKRWWKNKQHVMQFLAGERIDSGFKLCLKKAQEILAYDTVCRLRGIEPDMHEVARILNGPKIVRFARTIDNPRADCIVIDSWMIVPMKITWAQLLWSGVYELIEAMLMRLAHEYGFTTYSEFQAFIWILIRGKGE